MSKGLFLVLLGLSVLSLLCQGTQAGDSGSHHGHHNMEDMMRRKMEEWKGSGDGDLDDKEKYEHKKEGHYGKHGKDNWDSSEYGHYAHAWKTAAIVMGVILLVGVLVVTVSCVIVCKCKKRFPTTYCRSTCGKSSEKYKASSGLEKAVEAGVYEPPAYNEVVKQENEIKKY